MESKFIFQTSDDKEQMEKMKKHNQDRQNSVLGNNGSNGRDGLNGKPVERTSCYNRKSKAGLSGKKGRIVIR